MGGTSGTAVRAGLPALAAAILLAAGGPAGAQDRSLTRVIVDQGSIVERYAPPPARGSLSVELTDLRERLPEAAAAERRFLLRDVEVEGATLLPLASFEPLWAERLGSEVSLADAYGWADAMEAAYGEAGLFALVAVPEQDLASGRLRLVVFDRAYVETVEIRSEVPGLERRLAPYLDRIAALQPLRAAELERVLLLIADLAGMDVEARLSKPATPGNGGALLLEIELTPVEAQVALDNRGSDELGPLQLSGVALFHDLLGAFETTSLTVVTNPVEPQELVFLQLGQELPLGSDGLRAGYSAGYISSEPGGDLAGQDVEISTLVSNLYLSYPLVRTLGTGLIGRLDFNAKDEWVDVQSQAATRDHHRWLGLGLEGEQDTAIGSASLGLGFLQGLDLLGAGGELSARPSAPDDFRALTAEAALASPLSERLTLALQAAGQLGFDPLPPAVQQSFGGGPFGRAFESGVLSGDSGLAGALELAYDGALRLPGLGPAAAFAFADYAALWNRDEQPGFRRATLASAGLGLRALLPGGVASELSLAVPWSDADAVEDDGVRLFFSLGKAF